jgi:hypothetical protein
LNGNTGASRQPCSPCRLESNKAKKIIFNFIVARKAGIDTTLPSSLPRPPRSWAASRLLGAISQCRLRLMRESRSMQEHMRSKTNPRLEANSVMARCAGQARPIRAILKAAFRAEADKITMQLDQLQPLLSTHLLRPCAK